VKRTLREKAEIISTGLREAKLFRRKPHEKNKAQRTGRKDSVGRRGVKG